MRLPDITELQASIARFTARRVLVLGDLMLDEYWLGEASRISPEAPVPVVGVRSVQHRPGGASSVAMNAAALQGQVSVIGLVGEDAEGDRLLELLNGGRIDTYGVHRTNLRATTRKTRVIARQQQIVRVDREDTRPAQPAEVAALVERTERALERADILIVSDYMKGVATPEVLRTVIERARERTVPVVVDPKGDDFGKYEGASILTPNVSELGRAVDRQLDGDREIEEAARELIHELALKALLVTRSEKGLKLVLRDEPALDVPTAALEVFDVTGAGDTVVATLALGMAAGVPLSTCAVLANVAAGISVSRRGTATVTQGELLQRLV